MSASGVSPAGLGRLNRSLSRRSQCLEQIGISEVHAQDEPQHQAFPSTGTRRSSWIGVPGVVQAALDPACTVEPGPRDDLDHSVGLLPVGIAATTVRRPEPARQRVAGARRLDRGVVRVQLGQPWMCPGVGADLEPGPGQLREIDQLASGLDARSPAPSQSATPPTRSETTKSVAAAPNRRRRGAASSSLSANPSSKVITTAPAGGSLRACRHRTSSVRAITRASTPAQRPELALESSSRYDEAAGPLVGQPTAWYMRIAVPRVNRRQFSRSDYLWRHASRRNVRSVSGAASYAPRRRGALLPRAPRAAPEGRERRAWPPPRLSPGAEVFEWGARWLPDGRRTPWRLPRLDSRLFAARGWMGRFDR